MSLNFKGPRGFAPRGQADMVVNKAHLRVSHRDQLRKAMDKHSTPPNSDEPSTVHSDFRALVLSPDPVPVSLDDRIQGMATALFRKPAERHSFLQTWRAYVTEVQDETGILESERRSQRRMGVRLVRARLQTVWENGRSEAVTICAPDYDPAGDTPPSPDLQVAIDAFDKGQSALAGLKRPDPQLTTLRQQVQRGGLPRLNTQVDQAIESLLPMDVAGQAPHVDPEESIHWVVQVGMIRQMLSCSLHHAVDTKPGETHLRLGGWLVGAIQFLIGLLDQVEQRIHADSEHSGKVNPVQVFVAVLDRLGQV